jgi:UDP-3-O-[3-hydroxymyristoyl] glucosamine N-acyltransferase
MARMTLTELARLVGASVPSVGGGVELTGISSLAEATASEVSFCTDVGYVGALGSTRAAVVLVPGKLKIPEGVRTALLVVEDAELAVNKVLEHFAPPIARPAEGVSAKADVDATAELGAGCRVGAFVSVGARCRIGRNCVLHAGVVLGEDVKLGDDCELFANVVVRERCTLGNRVVMHAGSVVGSDGFGYRWDGRKHAKVPQIGTVVIGDDVEIGSCACVDRAKFAATVIGAGTKIDNLVQVGHNVRTGAHCIIVGQVGLAGSVTLGNGVVLGGQAAVRDHVRVGDGAMVAGCAGVVEDVEAKMIVSGMPALPHRQSLREQGAMRRLPELMQQMRKLQDEVEKLRAAVGGEGRDGEAGGR